MDTYAQVAQIGGRSNRNLLKFQSGYWSGLMILKKKNIYVKRFTDERNKGFLSLT